MKKLSFIAAIMALFICGCEKNSGNDEQQPGTLSFSGTMSVIFRGETVPTDDVKIDVSYEEDGTLSLIFNPSVAASCSPASLKMQR